MSLFLTRSRNYRSCISSSQAVPSMCTYVPLECNCIYSTAHKSNIHVKLTKSCKFFYIQSQWCANATYILMASYESFMIVGQYIAGSK